MVSQNHRTITVVLVSKTVTNVLHTAFTTIFYVKYKCIMAKIEKFGKIMLLMAS